MASTPARKIELVCPAGGLPSLKAAVDNGADCVYFGFKDATNARNFTGLNFDLAQIQEGITYARQHGRKVFLALNTYPLDANQADWITAIDRAAELGVDAIIMADPGLMAYAARSYPELRLHLSVQGSATSYEAINYYHEHFGIQRAVLPRVLSLAQIEQLVANTPVEIEVFGFGGLCVMVEGRCALSAYATGQSPNCFGACSPDAFVRWEQTPRGMETRLNGILINRYADDERASYPTLCKGRFTVKDETYYAIEEPASLNTLEMLPALVGAGISAIKIEGRQRNPAYVAQVTKVWRAALDALARDGERFTAQEDWMAELNKVSEGQSYTLGAYYRPWK
ncbi:MAG: U32 family peptidase [Proteobacteria bacterium]|nr:U32 family peptidase [Pseudomonadota bacterium]